MQLVRQFKASSASTLFQAAASLFAGFESTDPHLASRVVNALVDNYTEYNFRQKYDAHAPGRGRMEQQLDELKAKVENSQHELVDYSASTRS